MRSISILLYFVIVFLQRAILADPPSSWQITASYNQSCEEVADVQLVHVKAANATSSIHTFISASPVFKTPSLLVVHSSDPNASVWINCTGLTIPRSQAITVSNVTQSYSVIFFKIVEYNDTDDSANMSTYSSNFTRPYYFSQLDWYFDNTSVLEPDQSTGIFSVQFFSRSDSTTQLFTNESRISLMFSFSSQTQPNSVLPHLTYNGGSSSQFVIVMDKLHTTFSAPRFGLQLVLVANATVGPDNDFVTDIEHSLDDEVTPGTFKTVNVKLGDVVHPEHGSVAPEPKAFLQTKPVCYIDPVDRLVKSSRSMLMAINRDPLPPGLADRIRHSLPYVYYGNRINQNYAPFFQLSRQRKGNDPPPVAMRVQNVSFGSTKDGFYSATEYMVWTASFGFGDPPVSSFSGLLIGLIIITVVVIVAPLLASAVFFAIHRWRRSTPRAALFQPVGLSNSDLTNSCEV